MATKIGNVDLKWRNLEIYGFTGEILENQRSSETRVTGHSNSFTGQAQIQSHTTHYQHLFLRSPDGREDNLEFPAKVGFRAGQTATLVWASTKGPTKGEYVAVYNNTSGQINPIRRGNNRMACIPGYTWFAILAIILAVVGVATGSLIVAALGIAYLVFMIWSQRRLLKGVERLMLNYQPVAAGS
ncbi:hypothetical protein [Acidocella sp.]|uniref:hypothetical protein n=1 Tax=Acidocella sp. TaxID=50710 RepID=UPI0026343938|nr:hypothetical protein [Acidocella sp.]